MQHRMSGWIRFYQKPFLFSANLFFFAETGLALHPLKNEMNTSKPGNTGEIGGNRLLGMLAGNPGRGLIG
jgi:hypothetical protein